MASDSLKEGVATTAVAAEELSGANWKTPHHPASEHLTPPASPSKAAHPAEGAIVLEEQLLVSPSQEAKEHHQLGPVSASRDESTILEVVVGTGTTTPTTEEGSLMEDAPVAGELASATEEETLQEMMARLGGKVTIHTGIEVDVFSQVWGKIKGYPWWPGMLIRKENCPDFMHTQKHRADNLPVLFYGTRDYAWVAPGDLMPFAENRERLCKATKCNKAFTKAMADVDQPGALDAFLKDYERYPDVQPYIDKSIAAGASTSFEKPAFDTKKKKKRAAEEDEDDFGKTAKRKASTKEVKEVVKKERRLSSKRASLSQKQSVPPSQQLLVLRHKLQKIFLGERVLTEDFGVVDGVLKQIEEFPVTFPLLKETKIGKVIKRMSQMTIPNEPANVTQRAGILLDAWRKLLPSVQVESDAKQAAAAEDSAPLTIAEESAVSAHATEQEETVKSENNGVSLESKLVTNGGSPLVEDKLKPVSVSVSQPEPMSAPVETL